MRVIITIEEAIGKKVDWTLIADSIGKDYVPFVNTMPKDTEMSLTIEQAKKLGLI
jgi:hypothetical protein